MPKDAADRVRTQAETTFGVVPNFINQMLPYTGMPGAVYLEADAALMNGLLSPSDQQIVLLELARYFGSRYDAVVHARLALDSGVPPDVIDALLAGDAPSNDRIDALVEATRVSCKERGWLPPDVQESLVQRGVGRGELYEIFALIGMKAFTSFTNHLADTEVDDALKDTEERLSTVPEKPQTIERQRLFLG